MYKSRTNITTTTQSIKAQKSLKPNDLEKKKYIYQMIFSIFGNIAQ